MLSPNKKYKFIFGICSSGKMLFRIGSGMPVVCTLKQSELIYNLLRPIEKELLPDNYLACDIYHEDGTAI